MLRLVFSDMLQQQKQIRAMMKSPRQVTMDLFYGSSWPQNQHLSKTGTEETIGKLWKVESVSKHFNVPFKEFWSRATHREGSSNGLDGGTRFLFGSMVSCPGALPWKLTGFQIPSVYDINFHSYISNFGDRLHRSQHAASLVSSSHA
jgi:hypothetical protein